jgi:serine/threonine protein kinase
VYLAKDTRLERTVAVKVPSFRLLATAQAKEEFRREARNAAALCHFGIVPVYEHYEEVEGRCFIVYQFVEGVSLAELIQAGPLPLEEATRIVAQAAMALDYAHSHGLVHRDIKPANILLDRSNIAKITDFGLAVRQEDLAGQQGILAGTLPYMSPEQVRCEGHRLDGRTDIYSLGVVLYELLCGRRPFTADTQDGLIDLILHQPARPPRQIRDYIPPEVERICLKALSKQMSDRYDTAGDMARELSMAHLRQPVPSSRPRPTGTAREGTWVLFALVVIAILAGLIWFLYF